ncbi:MAG TPA: hypothetical protein VMT45_08500 [Thermoanaerobaculaceae bacterium]|nr:hypothetical protein [Thermoanaerobaculaceae bacterium]
MPHVIRAGHADLAAAWRGLPRGPWRWGNVVARAEGCFMSVDGSTLLVAGVVVEYGRPLHPVVVVSVGRQGTSCHLWAGAQVERTEGVKRFLARVASEIAAFGAGPVATTNIPDLL